MSGEPFEMIGGEAGSCVDGVCLPPSGAERARSAIEAAGIAFTVTQHGPVGSLTEAAEARGLEPQQLVKTLVVRRAEDDYVLALVPGDRSISWPKLRRVLGANRLSMPDGDGALAATGYAPGAITPFGVIGDWPVVLDASIAGTVSIGGGDHGVGFTLQAADLARVVGAQLADIT